VASGSDTITSSVIAAVVSSSVVSALVQAYFGNRLERDKAGWEAQLDRVKTEQDRVSDRLRTTFTALQTERARTIKNLYARIVRVEVILSEIVLAKAVDAGALARYRSAVSEFIDYYLPNRIWLPAGLSNQIGELRSTFFSLQKSLANAPPGPYSANFKAGLVTAKGATAHALEEVSFSFRELLGAETIAE
jgi:hypothetical protein